MPDQGVPLAEPLLSEVAPRSASCGGKANKLLCLLTFVSLAVLMSARHCGAHDVATQELFSLPKAQVIPAIRVAPAARATQAFSASKSAIAPMKESREGKVVKGREGRQRKRLHMVRKKLLSLQEQRSVDAYRDEKRIKKRLVRKGIAPSSELDGAENSDLAESIAAPSENMPYCKSGRIRPGMVVELSSDELNEELGDSSTPVLLHLYSKTDMNNTMMTRSLAKAANLLQRDVRIAKVDYDFYKRELWKPVKNMKVLPLPTIIIFDAFGYPVDAREGPMSAEQLIGFVNRRSWMKMSFMTERSSPENFASALASVKTLLPKRHAA